MNKGKVELDIEEYNSLRDFKQAIMRDECVITHSGFRKERIRFVARGEALSKIAKENEQLNLNIRELEEKSIRDKHRYEAKIEDSIASMSLFDIIKLKFKKP